MFLMLLGRQAKNNSTRKAFAKYVYIHKIKYALLLAMEASKFLTREIIKQKGQCILEQWKDIILNLSHGYSLTPKTIIKCHESLLQVIKMVWWPAGMLTWFWKAHPTWNLPYLRLNFNRHLKNQSKALGINKYCFCNMIHLHIGSSLQMSITYGYGVQWLAWRFGGLKTNLNLNKFCSSIIFHICVKA